MSKYTPKATPKKPAAKEAPKLSQPKVWRAEDYVNSNVSIEEVRDIKNAFDIFDTDSSGLIDPQELRKAFISLGFDLANKVTLTQLNDLVEENPEGLDFGNFLNLATGKLGETHTRAEINKIFSAFDNTRAVFHYLFREKSLLNNSRLSLKNLEST